MLVNSEHRLRNLDVSCRIDTIPTDKKYVHRSNGSYLHEIAVRLDPSRPTTNEESFYQWQQSQTLDSYAHRMENKIA